MDKELERKAAQYVYIRDIANYLGRAFTVTQERAEKMKLDIRSIRTKSGKTALAVSAADAKTLILSDTPRVDTISPEELMGGKP